jgi:mRNA-degrading endonuclease RelE of RelBE toxin-antitoxin system
MSSAVSTRSASSIVTDQEPYELVLTPPARRALTDHLPEPVAAAVIDFLTTALIASPRRVGKPLRGELAGIWSARRGTYRVLYRVREDRREVVVVRIDHRREVYRPR